ncbi:TonB-dependent siderophore receptor [Vibrio cyclitrophicus]|uniref:TonB-dependent siderophore receptor n=1 Tax=Vibrio TaxID=662 RepID=UPI00030DD231|nr:MULTISPECIES: TonB-dependent siderophore receptor [Vibrio]MCC4774667.1 TonB-dependent siderophore receptor [Vibrio cyclitrophicus]MCC4843488.1 TonB-dependent siderophore receptor [Vibrio cyclitrophicus]MDH5878912.1 TonB-dependent siderophore receptor [Vibrio sp. S/42/10]OBT09693.1 ligand-gated channel protein [Vibrio cyclitrophicus]OED89164.1 ligand-gated channel protein [Vibrio cyclitrophicus ZF30]|tara:strand:- start:127 stop:2223 length:2097 start_codon:yes stop_codon:yes gene_type:complete
MFSKSPLALVIGAVLASPAVLAETVKTDEHMVVEGRDYGYKADTNTTAMRMEATQLETPGQVSVIDEQIIDEQRATTLGDVLKNDASVSAGGTSRNRERFSLRGFSVESSSGFLKNGQQHWSHYRQPIELLERVEVLKGPSGLLYGISAPGGLINMVSKKPTYDTQVSLSQDIGSNDHTRTTLDVSGALNDAETLRGRAILSKESYGSWRKYGDGTEPQTERFVGGVYVDYDVTEDVTVSVHYDKTNDEGSVDSGALYTLDGNRVGNDKQIWDAQWSQIENDVENVGFDIAANLTDTWSVKTGFNYQDFERIDMESYPSFSNMNPDGTGTVTQGGNYRHDKWRFRTAYVDLTTTADLAGTEHQLLFGANWLGYSYYRGMDRFSSGEYAPDATVPVPSVGATSLGKMSTYDTWGFYIQDLITINDEWQVLAGARFDRKVSSGVAEENVAPKLGVIYHPVSNGSIYASYSESFEPQGVVSSGSRNYTNDGQLLDAATGVSYEVGTKWELMDERLFVSGAVFDITQENISMDVEDTASGDWTKTQGGEQLHRGAELAAQGFISERFSMSGSAMYLDAEIANHETYAGNRPVDVPEFAASVWSTYAATNEVDVNLGLIYEGSRYGDDANTFKKDGYARVDMGAAYTLKYDDSLDFVARLTVENVFDKEYLAGGGSTSSSHQFAEDVVIGEGRNYMATLQVKY